MASPVVIDPSIPEWKGHMPLDWLYPPPESIWNGGYTWNNPDSYWNNGLDTGQWGYDLDFDLNNDGNWATCLHIDGTNNSDHDFETYDWKTFLTSWDISNQGISSDSDNCLIRCRIKNRRNNVYSDYGYYGPVGIRIRPFPIFLFYANDNSYRWQGSSGSDYPTPVYDIQPNVREHVSVLGSRSTVKHGISVQYFEIYFPVLTATDIQNYRDFMFAVDYKKNAFIYRDREINYENPFTGTWKSVNVKFSQDILEISRDRADCYELTIRLRKTQEEVLT